MRRKIIIKTNKEAQVPVEALYSLFQESFRQWSDNGIDSPFLHKTLEEFGKVMAEGGSGIIIASQSGHRLPALPQEQNDALAMSKPEELTKLDFVQTITDTLKAYQYSKRCNVLRVAYEADRWAKRGATINSISPGIIITPLANDELHGPRAKGYLDMIAASPAHRAGTPDEVGDLAEFLMSSRGRFISGTDILIDGGTTASYWYGSLQYLKATH